jgi:hypothetical protein
METPATSELRRLVEYDSLRRRLWILGQRCHHGATGSVVAALACVGLMLENAQPEPRSATGARSKVVLALTGGAMMAHDWKDHGIWFERGRGSQL